MNTLSVLIGLLCLAVFSINAAELSLAAGGRTEYKIIIPAEKKCHAAEKFAATELAGYLGKITGTAFETVNEGTYAGAAIYLGDTEKARSEKLDASKLGSEEWIIRTAGKDLIITGGFPRGTLYGVYEFLDKHGGCRWVSPDLETVPKAVNFKIPEINISGKPAFIWREISILPGKFGEDAGTLYRLRNRLNVSGKLDRPEYGFAERFGRPRAWHTFYSFQEGWKDVKPEYYALFEGKRQPRGSDNSNGAQFCLTNIEVREKVYQTLLEFIRTDRAEAAKSGKPYPLLYDISSNDNHRYCQCDNCMVIAKSEGSYAGTNLDFMNYLGARLKNDYPDLKLSTFAYMYAKQPPLHVKALDNVIVRIALLDNEFGKAEIADAARPLTLPGNIAAKALIDRWNEQISPGNLFVWTYAQFFKAPYRYPYDTSNKIASDLEYLNHIGAKYTFTEHYSLDMPFTWLCKWIFAQKAIDPKRDTRALVDDFMAGYFGPAAKVMRQYYDYLVKNSQGSPLMLGSTPPRLVPYLNADFFRQVNVWLDDAEKLCTGNANEKYLRNVRFERIPVDSGMLYLWDKLAGKPGFENRNAVINRYYVNKKELCAMFPTKLRHAVFNCFDLDSEIAGLNAEIPAEFRDRSPLFYYAVSMKHPWVNQPVVDKDAAGGMATPIGKPELHKLPVVWQIRDSNYQEIKPYLQLDKVPADGKYHWYKAGTYAVAHGCGIRSDAGGTFYYDLEWAIMPPPDNELDIYVSLKFTGPAYIPGSTGTSNMLLDRIMAVRPEKH